IGVAMLVRVGGGPNAKPEDILAVRLPVEDPEALTCAKLTFTTGAAAGRSMYIDMVVGGMLIPGGRGAIVDLQLLAGVKPGDKVRVSDRDFTAYRHRYLYEIAQDEGLGAAQFEVDGAPIHPRRSGRLADHLEWTGAFNNKLILMQHLLDRPCWPTMAVAYDRKVRGLLGQGVDDRFRLYWSDQATHIPSSGPWSIDYSGLIEQGLLDMVRWVEEGVAPPPGTAYEWTGDSRVVLPPEAKARRGIQPTVAASANGALRAEARCGEAVQLRVQASTPAGGGGFIAVDWDFGDGAWSERRKLDGSQAAIDLATTHAFDRPGVHMVTVRVTAHRTGDPEAKFARLENQARCRVVVAG
ncbi:MAG: PKD domain-containing protein, partial [Caulobacteraceae bacterium]|nr:PKD domain-containing protein [Caulobacteraceae bacterium]